MMGSDSNCAACAKYQGVCPHHYELWLEKARSPGRLGALGSQASGIKDLTKPPAHAGLIENFPRTLLELAALSAHGIAAVPGRTPLDWQRVPEGVKTYSDAAMRHILARQIDPRGRDLQSKFPHLTHAIWSWLAVRELEIILDKDPGPVV